MKKNIISHRHNDDTGLCDFVIGQFIEDGVRVVVEVLQLLHDVVQLHHGPQGLSVHGAVDWRRVELQHGVVLAQRLLHKLKDRGAVGEGETS